MKSEPHALPESQYAVRVAGSKVRLIYEMVDVVSRFNPPEADESLIPRRLRRGSSSWLLKLKTEVKRNQVVCPFFIQQE